MLKQTRNRKQRSGCSPDPLQLLSARRKGNDARTIRIDGCLLFEVEVLGLEAGAFVLGLEVRGHIGPQLDDQRRAVQPSLAEL